MTDAALIARAEAAGLLARWRDIAGETREVSPETLRAALEALGAPAETTGALITADSGSAIALPVSGRARLTLENGDTRDILVGDGGATIIEIGYHSLDIADRRFALAIAPPRAPSVADLTGRARVWGAAAQIYSLRGRDAAGFGDFAALAAFADAAAAQGAQALAISPVHALFTAEPERFSPYSPSSRDWLNPLFAVPTRGAEPDGGALIDWPGAARARLARLRADFDAFAGDPAFDAFVATGGDALRGHALFEALHHDLHARGVRGGWPAWPSAFRDPASAEVAAFAAASADEVRFHLYLQWRADRDLAAARPGGMAIGLIADLAVGLDPGGSHAWSRRDELLQGVTLGAPPDAFNADGQGWGITGFSPSALRRLGFAPFLRTLRAALRLGGGVRVDHALGLGRLWVIPDGADPRDGVYLRQPIDDLLRLLALEAHRAGALVIGEDLGVVPDGFRDSLADRHLLGMRVLPFERDDEGGFVDPAGWTREAAALTGTHDMVPIAGWWRGVDIDWRERLGLAAESREQRVAARAALWRASGEPGARPPDDAPATAVDAGIGMAARSACELAIVPAEDLFGLDEAPNLPGTIDQHPNWRRRLPAPAVAMLDDPAAARRIARLNKERPA